MKSLSMSTSHCTEMPNELFRKERHQCDGESSVLVKNVLEDHYAPDQISLCSMDTR